MLFGKIVAALEPVVGVGKVLARSTEFVAPAEGTPFVIVEQDWSSTPQLRGDRRTIGISAVGQVMLVTADDGTDSALADRVWAALDAIRFVDGDGWRSIQVTGDARATDPAGRVTHALTLRPIRTV